MAEYIEREAFKRKLIDEKSFFPAIVARALEEMPATDVVPKSEVERLQAELEDKQFRCDSCDRIGLTHSEHIACIKQAKAEVAREIFEEIERLITKECLVFKDENGIRGYVDASVHYAISELKKKYTE